MYEEVNNKNVYNRLNRNTKLMYSNFSIFSVDDYKLNHYNAEPTGADLEEIENYATSAMNTRFGVNMAILTVSNAVQFDNLFRSFINAGEGAGLAGSLTKQLEGIGKIGLKKGSLDEFERKAATGIGGKVWEFVEPKIPNILSEGVYEEGGQFAAEKGVYDYYTRKYFLNNYSLTN